MSGIKLISTGSALPAQEVTNFDLEKRVDTSDEWIATRTGIRSRHYCSEGRDPSGPVHGCGAAGAGTLGPCAQPDRRLPGGDPDPGHHDPLGGLRAAEGAGPCRGHRLL